MHIHCKNIIYQLQKRNTSSLSLCISLPLLRYKRLEKGFECSHVVVTLFFMYTSSY